MKPIIPYSYSVGTKFSDAYTGTHIISGLTEEYVFHSYDNDGEKIEGATMLRSTFEKLVDKGVFWIW